MTLACTQRLLPVIRRCPRHRLNDRQHAIAARRRQLPRSHLRPPSRTEDRNRIRKAARRVARSLTPSDAANLCGRGKKHSAGIRRLAFKSRCLRRAGCPGWWPRGADALREARGPVGPVVKSFPQRIGAAADLQRIVPKTPAIAPLLLPADGATATLTRLTCTSLYI